MGAKNVAGVFQDSFVINFPTAGDYPFRNRLREVRRLPAQFLALYCNGQTPIPGTPETGLTAPDLARVLYVLRSKLRHCFGDE